MTDYTRWFERIADAIASYARRHSPRREIACAQELRDTRIFDARDPDPLVSFGDMTMTEPQRIIEQFSAEEIVVCCKASLTPTRRMKR